MMVGAHLISSGRKFQSEAAAVSINLFPNLTYNLTYNKSQKHINSTFFNN